jgi:transposase InsO family protein
MATITTDGARCGIGALSLALGLAPATYYRTVARQRQPVIEAPPRSPSPRALPPAERQQVLAILHDERFIDLAPAQVYASLLDEGIYQCSERTMYRVLAAAAEVRERRAQRRHPLYAAPELLATQPNQLWSWDITKLKGPTTWSSYHLYVMLDVFSRYVVGWMLATRESAILAERFIATCCERQQIARGQLTVHADRGTAMTSKPDALAPPRLQRQPVFRSAVQDPEVPARLSRALRLAPGCAGALHRFLPVVQHRASALGPRLAHPTRCALRARGRAQCPTGPRARGSLCQHARAVCPSSAHAGTPSHRGLDQSTQAPRYRGRCSVNSAHPVSQTH